MCSATMIPLGYMLKTVTAPAPDWMNSPQVAAVHSLSGCVSPNFGDYIDLWQHNGWWLFDTAAAVRHAAESIGASTETLSLFYYEAFDQQFVEEANKWQPIIPEASFSTQISRPDQATIRLSGYDVVTFFAGTSPECSPLSCNGLAASLPANDHGLFDSFDAAYAAVENGNFHDSEPGPYRIIAVYLVVDGAT
jgi:hypothetical protein